jgi:Calcineurin-like phosphoesterase.
MDHKGKTFVVGDIHGAHKALVQVLERSGFDKENDLLITLGDIADGWSEVYEVVEELLTIKHRIDIIGNHDEWDLLLWKLIGILLNGCKED